MRLGPRRFSLSPEHQRSVKHNASEPGCKGRSAFETAQMKVSGKERILDCIFRVLSVSQNGLGDSYEFWAGGHKHLLEGFHILAMRLSFNTASGLVANGPARGCGPVPFSCSENMQGLADRCYAGALIEARRFGCAGHWRSPFPPLLSEATAWPARDLRWRIADPFCFQQKSDTRAARRRWRNSYRRRFNGRDLTITSSPRLSCERSNVWCCCVGLC